MPKMHWRQHILIYTTCKTCTKNKGPMQKLKETYRDFKDLPRRTVIT